MNEEARLLSAVLKDKQVHVVLQANADSLFKTHADVWQFIKDYYEKNNSVPPPNLVMDKFTDFAYADDVGATKYHLDELRNRYLEDSLKQTLRRAASSVQDGSINEALAALIDDTANLVKTTSTVRDIDAVDVDAAIGHFELIKEINELGSFGIKTGLKGFDDYMPSGITPGQFGLFLAYPAIGKSWLMLYFAVQAWANGKKPLIISLEMTEAEVRNRAYTIMGAGLWSHRHLSLGDVDLDDFRRWAKSHLEGKPPFHIVSSDGSGVVTPAVLRGKIDQYKPDVVFVDYIQLMESNKQTDNEVVKIKSISRDLKLLAIAEDVPIIAIASATPDDVTDMSAPPALGQVAWSKQLSYDADWVLALGRGENSDVIEAVFRKNRNGYLGDFLIQVDFNAGRFRYKDFEEV